MKKNIPSICKKLYNGFAGMYTPTPEIPSWSKYVHKTFYFSKISIHFEASIDSLHLCDFPYFFETTV